MLHFCTDECDLGYYEETDFVCYKCSDNCRSCETHTDYCSSCNVGKFLYAEDQSVTCLDACPEHYYADEFFECRVCDDNCANCSDDPLTCISCPEDWFLDGTVCVNACPTGKFPDETLSCKACNVNCKECAGTWKTCTVCNEDVPFLLEDATCVTTCADFSESSYPTEDF